MLVAVGKAEANTRSHWRHPRLTILLKNNPALHGKKDYVTAEVDEENQRIIFDHLADKYPHTRPFGEELGQDTSPANPSPGDTRWVLDPLDSTRNFIAGTSDYSISLAYQEFRSANWQSMAAVVAAPSHNKVFWAEQRRGAFQVRVETTSQDILERIEERVRVRKRSASQELGSRLDRALQERMVEILLVKEAEALELAVIKQIHDADRRAIKMIDSGALALSMMGTERDGVITGGLTEHDKTAGLLIAKEAGAVMTEIQLKGYEAVSGGIVHVVASDQTMLRALAEVVNHAVREKMACHRE
jgi:fructose-1,6-bisphosphatase/inositol monophosphatase family enzyme